MRFGQGGRLLRLEFLEFGVDTGLDLGFEEGLAGCVGLLFSN